MINNDSLLMRIIENDSLPIRIIENDSPLMRIIENDSPLMRMIGNDSPLMRMIGNNPMKVASDTSWLRGFSLTCAEEAADRSEGKIIFAERYDLKI